MAKSILDITIDQLSLTDLMAGVIDVFNDDGFPLESCPPKGCIYVVFRTKKRIAINGSLYEYRRAVELCAAKQAGS